MTDTVSANRKNQLFRVMTVLVTVGIFVLLAASILDELRSSRDRIGIYADDHEQGLLLVAIEPGLPAEEAGILPDDVLIGLEGEEITDVDSLNTVFARHFEPGQALTFEIQRGDQQLSISLIPGVTPDIAGLLAQIVLVMAYLGLAILAAQYRNQDLRARLLMIFVALIAIELAMPNAFSFNPLFYICSYLVFFLMTGIQISLELHLVSLIPKRLKVLKSRPWLVYLYYLLGAVIGLTIAGLAAYEWLILQVNDGGLATRIFFIVMVGWAAVVPAILLWQIWRTDEPRGRNQALLVLIGLLPWVIYIFVSTFWPGWEAVGLGWTTHVENLVLLFFPAAIFLAIFRYGLFDVEHVVRRGLVFGTIAVLILILLYTLLTAALPWIADFIGEDTGMWLVTGMALLTGVLFRPLRNGVEQLVETGLFPERRALRHRLIGIATALSEQGRMDELVERLASQAREALGLSWAAVVAIEGPGRELHTAFSDGIDARRQKELVKLLNTETATFASLSRNNRPISIRRLARREPSAARALTRVGAEVLVPLYFQRRMIGILCLATKQSGELFVREELELLDLFSHQIAASFENLRLFQDATYEELTGLLRREAVLRQLQAECERAARNATPLTVFMMDLDHFKIVNDSHGHLFGDQILQKVSQTMRDRIRAVDALGRYGGEEFLLVLPDTDIEGARLLAEELRQDVSSLDFTTPDGMGTINVTISIGIATASPRQIDSLRLEKALLEHADAAVYEAKAQGRNCIIAHESVE